MAMTDECGGVVDQFEDWYKRYEIDDRHDCLADSYVVGPKAAWLYRLYEEYKRDADTRFKNYEKLEFLADGQVTMEKPDLPNISAGDTAGLMRRVARAVVQNTPNVEILCKFDDDSKEGVFVRQVLKSQIIGSDQYSNDMQQNLFASAKSAFTLGFDAVTPALVQEATGGWRMEYDSIFYRDVFADPGIKDVRKSESLFVRRYLTQGEVRGLIHNNVEGWDIAALKNMVQTKPSSRKPESNSVQNDRGKQLATGYEVITWYNSWGEPFLTFDARTKMLLRIEKNHDPLHRHPVFFLVLEKDDQHPYGKSQVELLYGRQDFQDLMLNGAMKLWYRNINPTIIGYGAANAVPNLGPGKYTNISNPNARIEAFEVNTQTLMQFGSISQMNNGAMIGLVGSPDQQTASQGVYDTMSATPQGVEQQAAMVDVTTNNFQKAVEGFFSHYCSYALTVYFNELKYAKTVKPNAETRKALLDRMPEGEQWFNEDGTLDIDFKELADVYYVRCVPGSLVELEDEKQIRMLQELFVSLSQAAAGISQMGDQQLMKNASLAMQYIISQQIELSGSSSAQKLKILWERGDVEAVQQQEAERLAVEEQISAVGSAHESELTSMQAALNAQQDQLDNLSAGISTLLSRLGISNEPSENNPNTSEQLALTQ